MLLPLCFCRVVFPVHLNQDDNITKWDYGAYSRVSQIKAKGESDCQVEGERKVDRIEKTTGQVQGKKEGKGDTEN